ncbi:MAG: PaaI family thioesterase [Gordonia sp. (in: high G+C Gram-positive bacteria)]|uniref:PaaI family thioesterase n=1 Tax=Gordonia sp. (in: high G+C Gram-positive bacteria) TaxID=84139 RepID=UPI003BB62782
MAPHTTSESTSPVRERTYSWVDPQVFASAARELDGIDFFTQLGDGAFPPPPINNTLGMSLVDISDGRAVFELTPQEWHYNPIGTVHGGVLATLADSALGCAVHTKLSAGTAYTSLDLTIKFTRAATIDSGLLTCEGTVVSIGRRTATAEAQITDKTGRVIGHAIATCLIMPIEP